MQSPAFVKRKFYNWRERGYHGIEKELKAGPRWDTWVQRCQNQ